MADGRGQVEPYWRLTMACLAGPCLWAVHFAVVYGGSHFVCYLLEPAKAEALLDSLVMVATVAIGVVIAALLKSGWFRVLDRAQVIEGDNLRFLEHTARGLALLSLFGVIWAGIAVYFIPSCVGQ